MSDSKRVEIIDRVIYYHAEIKTYTDYYAFGMEMVGRNWSEGDEYRFGHNGQEKSKEVGEGNYTAEFWEYDSQVIRRFNTDPIVKEHESPYLAFGGNPILNTDVKGDDAQKQNCDGCPTGTFNFGITFGSNGFKAHIDFSLDKKMGDFTASYGFGAVYHTNFWQTGKSGVELRNSVMANYDDGKRGVSFGTNFWGGLGKMQEFAQRTGMLSARFGNFSMAYENDGIPFADLGLGDNGDSYRTAAIKLGWNDISLDVNLFTGNRSFNNRRTKEDSEDKVINKGLDPKNKAHQPYIIKGGFPAGRGKFGEYYEHGFVNETGSRYRYGGLVLNYGGISGGINSEWIRHKVQNKFAHDIMVRQRQFEMLSGDFKPISESSSSQFSSKYSLWAPKK